MRKVVVLQPDHQQLPSPTRTMTHTNQPKYTAKYTIVGQNDDTKPPKIKNKLPPSYPPKHKTIDERNAVHTTMDRHVVNMSRKQNGILVVYAYS
jgi:hypothetical protein